MSSEANLQKQVTFVLRRSFFYFILRYLEVHNLTSLVLIDYLVVVNDVFEFNYVCNI